MLSSFILGGKIVSIVGLVGTDVVVKTLTASSTSIINIITHLSTTEFPNSESIKKALLETDIELKMKVINSLVNDLKKKINLAEAINIALGSLAETTEKIHNQLDLIKDKIEYHKLKYFQTWRNLNCDENLNNIKKLNNILDKRLDLLTKILSIKY